MCDVHLEKKYEHLEKRYDNMRDMMTEIYVEADATTRKAYSFYMTKYGIELHANANGTVSMTQRVDVA